MARIAIKKMLEKSKKSLDKDYDKFSKRIDGDLASLKKKALDGI